jgi:transcription antitermination factor NusG
MDVCWYVAHVRPRCEKKLAEFCQREGFEFTLPLYRSVKRYRGKKVEFQKPLFPGYVFLKVAPESAPKLRQNQHVANLLEPPDQTEFEQQLGDILRALDSEVEVRLAPQIVEGQRVRIKYGPLRGLEAVVVERSGALEVHLRLDFIGQAAALHLAADELEPI